MSDAFGVGSTCSGFGHPEKNAVKPTSGLRERGGLQEIQISCERQHLGNQMR
jgi:hypothetical protein